MLRQDPFDRFLSDINQNLQIVKELETTLGQIHDTASRRNHDQATSEHEPVRVSDFRRAAAF